MDLDKLEDKIDKILEKVTNIELKTAVQQEQIDTHHGYFKYVASTITGVGVTVLIMILKLFF